MKRGIKRGVISIIGACTLCYKPMDQGCGCSLAFDTPASGTNAVRRLDV